MSLNWRARLAEAMLRPWFLWTVLAAALGVRLAWALAAGDQQRFWDVDSYIRIADNLLAGNGFLWGDQRVGRPPLYPLLVAATRFGLLGREFLALYLVQAVLSTATVAIFAAAVDRLLGTLAARVTAVIVALDPFLVFQVATALSETLFVFLLAVFFYGIVRALDRPGAWPAILAGAAAGASFLTRPSLLFLVAAFVVMVAFWARPRGRAILAASLICATALAVTLPWAARNHRITGHWVFTTLGVGASLYDGLGPQADGSSDMDFLHSMPELTSMSEYERDVYLRDKALEAARRDPGRVARLALVKVARFWSPVPNSDRFRGPAYVVASLVAVIPVYALALAALLTGTVGGRRLFILMTAPVYFTLVHAVFVGSARYRAPVMPFVAAVAASAVAAFLARRLGSGEDFSRRDGEAQAKRD